MIIGNLTRDPEIRNTPTGQSVASFAIATNFVWVDQSGQKQEKVEFHNIVAWRRLAEICGQYLKKGSKIFIEGRLQTRDWVGQDGVKRYRTEIIAENMIMLDRPAGGGQAFGQNQGGYQRQNQNFGNNANANYGAPVTEQPYMQSEPVIDVNDEPVISSTADEFGVVEEEIKVENIPF